MDIAELRVIRSPVADTIGNLRLVDEIAQDPRPPRTDDGDGDQQPSQPEFVFPITIENLPSTVGDPTSDPLAKREASVLEMPLDRLYYVIAGISRFLLRANDRLAGDEVARELARLEAEASLTDAVWPIGGPIALLCLSRAIADALQGGDEASCQRAVELTRLALVCDLCSDRGALGGLTTDEITARLQRRCVVMSEGGEEPLPRPRRTNLVRAATVADLHVIRREWACYQLGEVANIRNLMAGESLLFRQTQLTEREDTIVDETEREEETETEGTSKFASELTTEINSQIDLSVEGTFRADAQYKTPVSTVNIAGGADVSLNLQRSERFASKIARECVTRAVKKVDTRNRNTRTERELRRSEDLSRYEVKNTGDGNLRAVYRWVDRVDRYQVFRYPERLQLEFQLPEPAEFYRARTKASADAAAATEAPPPFTVKAEDITPANLIKLATDYRASNLPAPPDEKLGLTRTLTIDLTQEALPDGLNKEINAAGLSKEMEIPIPTDYAAETVTYSGHGYPIWGVWRIGSVTQGADEEGFRSGFATVSVGDKTKVDWVGGYKDVGGNTQYFTSHGDNTDKGSVEAVQLTNQPGEHSVRSVHFGRAMLLIGSHAGGLQPGPSTAINLSPGVALSLKVGVSTSGLSSCIVTFMVTCKRTEQAVHMWQLNVYDALFSAWSQWKKDYESAQLRSAIVGGSGLDAGSSSRNEQIVREEIKRQVISMLLDEEDFAGRPALLEKANDAKFRGIDFDRAVADAPTIQFLEQAFEWGNMLYVFYPYFWADIETWPDLASLAANDPEFERFLRAGSARVVVPARRAFDDAVTNWLKFGVPFVTGQLPAFNEKYFIAIDREIRDLSRPWDGGIAEDFWEARVSTTMLYLEDDGSMPIANESATLPVARDTLYEPRPLCGPLDPTTTEDGQEPDDDAPAPV